MYTMRKETAASMWRLLRPYFLDYVSLLFPKEQEKEEMMWNAAK